MALLIFLVGCCSASRQYGFPATDSSTSDRSDREEVLKTVSADMFEFKIYIGLNDKDSHEEVMPPDKAELLATQLFGDCTIQQAHGHFTHEDGTKDDENTLIIIIFRTKNDLPRIKRIASELKKLLHQKTVIISWRPMAETIFY